MSDPPTLRHYSIAQARDHFTEIVHRAEAGATVEITRRGRPVAVIVSQREYTRLGGNGEDAWSALQRFWAENDSSEYAIDEDFLDGLRDTGPGRDVSVGD